MSIFDKFSDSSTQPSTKRDNAPLTRERRKEIGQERELKAIDDMKRLLTYPSMLLNGIHLFSGEEVCEIDGLYVTKDTMYITEIKSKNFSYLYGNTDTGHWYVEYENKTIKSDNVYRQISRQMRILSDNFPSFKVLGHIFMNNKLKDVRMDIIGPKPGDIELYTDIAVLCQHLNKNTKSSLDLIAEIQHLDKQNKKRLPKEWI